MNENTTSRTCPECGNTIPPDAPRGLCPKCVLGIVAASIDAGPLPTAHDLPSLEAVKAAFPQLEVMELIGQGGMGFVYKARQPNLDRFVALKLLWPRLGADPLFAERFNREARVLARLNHPNIVAVYDFGRSGEFFYLLMEFVDGVNLRQAMQAGGYAPSQALALVPKICEALQFAHEEGILHRDIKPENILLDTKGRVKIADFGIAKLVGEARENLTLTATGMAVGTPHYMAPEQIEHPQDVDQRADIYSLGVVFYEMLTGELPIGRFAPPSEKSTVDPRVDAVVLRALEREREKRYRTAGEVKTRVDDIRSTPPPVGPHGTAAVGRTAHPAAGPSDFILCNPRLPRMAQAIVIYGILVAPVLYLLGVLGLSSEPTAAQATAVAVQKCTVFFAGTGSLIGIIALLVGGFKLRSLRPDALRWIRQGLWLRVGMVAFHVLGMAWADALDRRAGSPTFTPWETAVAIVAVGSLVWEVACLVWLHRHAQVLYPTLGLPSPRPAALHANAAAIWTALSLALTVGVTGVFLAAPLVAAWQWGEPAPLYRLGPMALMVIGAAVLVCGVKGLRAGWQALRELRSSQGQVDGVRRAVFGAAAWPLVLTMGASTLCATVALVQSSLHGLAVIFLSLVVSLTTGEFLLRGAWRWTMVVGRGQRRNPAPRWIHRWVLMGQLVAIAVFVPVGILWFGPDDFGTPDQTVNDPEGIKASGAPAASDSGNTATNGVDLEFTVPGGQVAVFEIVKRGDSVVVPVPDLAAYVIAPEGASAAGRFCLVPAPDDPEGLRKPWTLELVSPAGYGRNSVNVPPSLANISGRISLRKNLEPDREFVVWAGLAGDTQPAMGLRVRTQAHRLKAGFRADGSMTTNWLKAASVN